MSLRSTRVTLRIASLLLTLLVLLTVAIPQALAAVWVADVDGDAIDENWLTVLNDDGSIPSDINMAAGTDALYFTWVEWNPAGWSQVRVARFSDGERSFIDGGPAGINYAPGKSADTPRLVVIGSVLYVAWQEELAPGGSSLHVRRYNTLTNTWAAIDGGTAAGLTMGAGTGFALASLAGKLCVAWSEQNPADSFLLRVSQYDDASGLWNPLGVPLGDPTFRNRLPSLAAHNGQLYVAWDATPFDLRTKLMVQRFSPVTGLWSDAGSSTIDPGLPAQGLHHVILCADGANLYAICQDFAGDGVSRIRARQCGPDGVSWLPIDGPGLNYDLSKYAYLRSVTTDNGNLYVASSESGAGDVSQLRVREYSGGTWSFVDDQGLTGGAGGPVGLNTLPLENTVSSATLGSYALAPYIAWIEAGQVIIKKYDRAMTVASDAADLQSLALSAGTLAPAFQSDLRQYSAAVAHSVTSVTLTPTLRDTSAAVRVNGVPVQNGQASLPLALTDGATVITVDVYSLRGVLLRRTVVTVNRPSQPPTFALGLPLATNTMSNAFDLRAQTDEQCTVYYVVLGKDAATPSAAQVRAGQDASGSHPVSHGALPLAAATPATATVTGLTEATAYDVYIVAEDGSGNLMASPAQLGVTTPTATRIAFSPAVYNPFENAGSVTLAVTRTDSVGAATVEYMTIAGDAAAGLDYEATSGIIQFVDGVATRTITVPIIPDALAEEDETFSVQLLNPSGGAIVTQPTAVVTIADDDRPPRFYFGAGPYAPREDVGSASVTVVRTNNLAVAVTVDYATTVSGSATAGADYLAVAGQLEFGPGESEKTVSVPIVYDAIVEGDEVFYVRLSNPSSGSVLAPMISVVIKNVEPLPVPVPPAPPALPTVDVIIAGAAQVGGTISTQTIAGRTVTSVTVDPVALAGRLADQPDGATVAIPVSGSADALTWNLAGATMQSLVDRGMTLQVGAPDASLTLPASSLDLAGLAAQLPGVALNDTTLSLTIAQLQPDMVRVVEDSANRGNLQIVVQPIDFTITCTHDNQTATLSHFAGYVDRTVAVPEGVDPSRITTAVVLNADGTLTHVPTEIVTIDGRGFARIHSLTNSTYTLVYHPVEFADVASHWSRAAVNNMGSRLIITGYADGTFQPENPITRAEFATLIVRALGLRLPTRAVPFSDVKAGDWFYDAVRLAHENGIISGYSDGTFRPNGLITREEAMAMLSRAMGVAKLSAGTGGEVAVAAFRDAKSVSDWSLAAVRACVSAGLANGSDGYLRPQASITRAETATMLQRLLQKAGLID